VEVLHYFYYLCALQNRVMKVSTTIIYFIIFTVAIAIPAVALQQTGYGSLIDGSFWSLFTFMSALTLLVLMAMVIVYHKNPDYFAQAFLGATTVKILACFIFIFIFLRNNKINKSVFPVDFLYIYLLNTAFEVYVLLRNLRHKNSR
jgi:fucose 4-O-acetylase-like acetyltransferase